MTQQKLRLPWIKRLFYTTRERSDERSRLVAVANNLILHLHPTNVPAPALRFTYTWGLGGISAVLALLLGLTGLLLMFRYDARTEFAYISIQKLESEVMFGSLVRALHHWSANLLVVTTFLHLLRVFFTGGFKQGRTANWVIGVGLLLIVLASNFTGYLLPWDQLAYWAITVSTNLLGYIPLIGQAISRFLLAGPEVGQGALSNFYAIHVVVLPTLLIGIMAYHFWKVRKNGGLSQPLRSPSERIERLTTIPNLVVRELAVALAVLALLVVFSMLSPAPLESIANPLHSPNPAKAAWYFVGLQELLLHMHPLAAMCLAAILLSLIVAIPWWDQREEDIGIYFRSANGRQAAVIGALLSLNLVPLLVVLDEYWLDLPALLPAAPAAFTTGWLPFLATLLGLAGIYGFLRLVTRHRSQPANHSEALLGVFVFVMISLVLLTFIGQFFRGPNMALVLPF
jgi:quinol-cytochrome oxidoreductase complex cytochrome b subunit